MPTPAKKAKQRRFRDCKECGEELVQTSDTFCCCPNGHGKLVYVEQARGVPEPSFLYETAENPRNKVR